MNDGMLSQEEIDLLLRGTLESDPQPEQPQPDHLDEIEKDALGEIANISMGTAATTLSQLLGKKVEITTPKVNITTAEQIRKEYPIPFVICCVKFKAGLEGSNLLILSQEDGSVIVDLMMGGEGKDPTPVLSELQLSGISEAMNQMIGSAATSMSNVFNSIVDIYPPNLVLVDLSMDENALQDFLGADEQLVSISFRMVVENVIDSVLIQVIPVSVAKGMVNKLMSVMAGSSYTASEAQIIDQPQSSTALESNYIPPPYSHSNNEAPPNRTSGGYSSFGTAHSTAQVRSQGSPGIPVQPAQFAPLQSRQPILQPDNLDLILDLPLQISVELGRAKKTIKEILEMGPGSVIELDRLAGESVDMIVNGKLIAKCEVVVINETFGIRIAEIIHPMERMYSLKKEEKIS